MNTPLEKPTSDNRDDWKAYWQQQGQLWRTEPEISAERQAYLNERRGITPDIKQGIYPFKDLEPKLAEIFATRQEKVMFVKGDADLDFGKVAEVIDIAHEANVDKVGLMTPKIESGN